MRATRPSAPVTMFSYVGNLGCIRFPAEIRKVAGIKRGDRLALSVAGSGSEGILLEKVAAALPDSALEVSGCACEGAPAGCGGSGMLTVGWSYVQLGDALATDLGFLPGRPIRILAEPARITVSPHSNRRDLTGVPRVACPP
jgi:hypothetical protein